MAPQAEQFQIQQINIHAAVYMKMHTKTGNRLI